MIELDPFFYLRCPTLFLQDVAYGQQTLKLESGERLAMANIIRTVTRSTMIAQYLVFCEDDGFQPLSRATMYRVLKAREASLRKSLQGLDNVSADGAESFQRITRIVEELEEEYRVSKDWCSDVRNRLMKAKCCLKTEYRVHCRDEDSRCADNCRKFALSDPFDEDFKHQCLHDLLSKCDSCKKLRLFFNPWREKSMNFALRCTPKNNTVIFFMTLESPSTSSTNGNTIFSNSKAKRSQNKASYKT